MPARKRRKRATDEQLQLLQEILDEVFCDGIPVGSIVPGSCNLQILNYDDNTAVCDYLLTISMVDETAVVAALNTVNDEIADNPAIPADYTATPGQIGGFS